MTTRQVPRIFYGLIVLAIAATIVTGCTANIPGQDPRASADQSSADKLKLSGRIEADEIKLAVTMPGTVSQVKVSEGDKVTAGQVVLQLKDDMLSSQLKANDAVISAAETERTQARQWLGELKDELGKDGNADIKKKKHNKTMEMLEAAQMNALNSQMKEVESKLSGSASDLAKARLTRQELLNRKSAGVLTSPINGWCTSRNINPGEIAVPGQILVRLLSPEKVYMKAFIPEGQLGKIKIGQSAKVHLDGTDKPIAAKIVSIDHTASFTPENVYFKEDRVRQVFGIKLRLDNSEGLAKPGMPAEVEIALNGAQG